MSPKWTLGWPQCDGHKQRRDALADPLEMEEWQGLAWSLPLLSRWSASARRVERTEASRRREATIARQRVDQAGEAMRPT